jgi:glucan phosphoethanolaminetransferase (alkaline phosphatase superfamily)
MSINNKIRKVNLLLSFLGCLILFIDVTKTKEFGIEPFFLVSFISILIFNFLRQIIQSLRQNKTLSYIVNILLLVILTFSLYSLLIISFGIEFIGRSYPMIVIISLLYNISHILILLYDFGKNEDVEKIPVNTKTEREKNKKYNSFYESDKGMDF